MIIKPLIITKAMKSNNKMDTIKSQFLKVYHRISIKLKNQGCYKISNGINQM